jgi:hypothetical protein
VSEADALVTGKKVGHNGAARLELHKEQRLIVTSNARCLETIQMELMSLQIYRTCCFVKMTSLRREGRGTFTIGSTHPTELESRVSTRKLRHIQLISRPPNIAVFPRLDEKLNYRAWERLSMDTGGQ